MNVILFLSNSLCVLDDTMSPFSIVPLFPSYTSVDILLNRSQQLFASCTAKFADGQQCSIPVFDITHQTPLCEEHAKKMVSLVFKVKVPYLVKLRIEMRALFGKIVLN